MFTKLSAVFNLFRKGQEVANPGAWKDAQNYGMAIGAFLLALANIAEAFGYALPAGFTAEQANVIGLGIATAVAFVINNITSAKTGLLPEQPPVPSLRPAQFEPELPPVAKAAVEQAASRFDPSTVDRAKQYLSQQRRF